jgi:hypothetical protein
VGSMTDLHLALSWLWYPDVWGAIVEKRAEIWAKEAAQCREGKRAWSKAHPNRHVEYRQRIKADPVAYAEYLRKIKERRAKRKRGEQHADV